MGKFYYNVYQQRITVTPPCGLVGDSINYLSADFIFSEDWNGLYKVCYFAEKPEDNVPYQVPLQDDTIRADMHLNLWPGTWYTWISGDKTENGEVVQRITTNVVEFTVDESGVIGGVPFEVAPSVQEDVLAKAEEALNKVNDLEQRADSGEFQGKPGVSAGFGNVTASVDANTGTPSVEVRTSGTNEALNINFAFHNLKGEAGGGGGGAVDSVNGQTGEVVLTAEDVGALPENTTIPSKTSELENDAGYVTAATAPVRSVNRVAGAVITTKLPIASGTIDNIAVNYTQQQIHDWYVAGMTVRMMSIITGVARQGTLLELQRVTTNTSRFCGVYEYNSKWYMQVIEYNGSKWLGSEKEVLLTDTDIDMNQHNIHNVGEVDLTYLSIGATIGDTTNARLTGTSDGKAAFVKDNTQSTLVPVQVGAATQANEAVQRGQVAGLAPVQSVNGATGKVKGTYYVQFTGTLESPVSSASANDIANAVAAGYSVQSIATFTNVFDGLPIYGQLFVQYFGAAIMFGGSCTPNALGETRTINLTIGWGGTSWHANLRAIESHARDEINLLDYGAADGMCISRSQQKIIAANNYVTIGGRDWIDVGTYGYTSGAVITVSQATNVIANKGEFGCTCHIIKNDGSSVAFYIDPGETEGGTFIMNDDNTGFTFTVKRPDVAKVRFSVGGNAGLIKATMLLS